MDAIRFPAAPLQGTFRITGQPEPTRPGEPASSAAPRPTPSGPDLTAFREYARARGLREDDFLDGVRTLLADPAPSPPAEDRPQALLRLLEAFPPAAGRTLLGSCHREVLTSIHEMLAPPKNDVERKGMTVTGYVTSYRDAETIEVKTRRADQPVAPYLQAVDDYIALAKLVGKGFQKPEGNLAEVRYGAVSAFQVEYLNLYREPVMTGLFREFLPEVGRSDYALHLARTTRDWSPAERQVLRDAHGAVKSRSGGDQAWRSTRLAMDCRQPGEDLPHLALEIDRAWSEGNREATRLNKEFPGLRMPKLEPLVLSATETRPPGASPVPQVLRTLEGYFLTGTMEGLAPLDRALEEAFPAATVPPALRERLEDQLLESVKARRRQGLDPETSLQRAVEDCRILVAPAGETADPGTIEADGEHVRIGGISLEIRR